MVRTDNWQNCYWQDLWLCYYLNIKVVCPYTLWALTRLSTKGILEKGFFFVYPVKSCRAGILSKTKLFNRVNNIYVAWARSVMVACRPWQACSAGSNPVESTHQSHPISGWFLVYNLYYSIIAETKFPNNLKAENSAFKLFENLVSLFFLVVHNCP